MKHLLSILLICSIGFTQELTVEGDLNVTGNIQNQTIDSLLQVIQDLQSQLSALQSNDGYETRFFDFSLIFESGTNEFLIDIEDLTGFDLDFSSITLIHREILGNNGNITEIEIFNGVNVFPYTDAYMTGGKIKMYINDNFDKYYHINGPIYTYEDDTSISVTKNTPSFEGIINLKLAITAQFPDSNVQQRKPGLQSKDKETVK